MYTAATTTGVVSSRLDIFGTLFSSNPLVGAEVDGEEEDRLDDGDGLKLNLAYLLEGSSIWTMHPTSYLFVVNPVGERVFIIRLPVIKQFFTRRGARSSTYIYLQVKERLYEACIHAVRRIACRVLCRGEESKGWKIR